MTGRVTRSARTRKVVNAPGRMDSLRPSCALPTQRAKRFSGPSNVRSDPCVRSAVVLLVDPLLSLHHHLLCVWRTGSANVLFLASTVMVPIGNVAFSLKFVPHHQDLRPSDTMGLLFILTGVTHIHESARLFEVSWRQSRCRLSIQ